MVEQVVQPGRRHVVAQRLQQDAGVAVGEPDLVGVEQAVGVGPPLGVWNGLVAMVVLASHALQASTGGFRERIKLLAGMRP